MTTNEIKNLKVGDKVLVKAISASMVEKDEIKTVAEIQKDRILLESENGFSGYVRHRELMNDKWYEVVR